MPNAVQRNLVSPGYLRRSHYLEQITVVRAVCLRVIVPEIQSRHAFSLPRFIQYQKCARGTADMQHGYKGIRRANQKYPAEIIPVRLSEIYQINEAYEWVSTTVKELLKKDFQGQEEDIANMQQIMDNGSISAKKKEAWLALGITLCVILANEVDGLEWYTLIDGNREAPVLMNIASNTMIDPMKLVWSKVKAGEICNLAEVYKNLLS